MDNIPPIIKYSEEQSSFIQGRAISINREWFVMPMVFQRVGKNHYREWLPENLPEGIKKEIEPIFPKLKLIDNEQV